MSSLAAARADNFYYGADEKKKRKRPRSSVITIRFEMPWKVWCTACDKIIAKGVRFNAQKRKIGDYHTTPIFEFTMKCTWCPGIIKIKTDPQNAAFEITQGAKKKIEWEAPIIESDPERDTVEILEKHVERNMGSQDDSIDELVAYQRERQLDPLYLNSIARKQLRRKRQEERQRDVNFVLPKVKSDALTISESLELQSQTFRHATSAYVHKKALAKRISSKVL